jgi:sporulation protein YlmC with PRC-barrel domain
MRLQIQQGAALQTAEGLKVGKIDGIVIDPLTNDVSHVVVNESGITSRKRVASLTAIRMASEELATLGRDIDLEDLPPLDEIAYSRAGDEPIRDRPDAYTHPSQMSSPTVWLSPEHGKAHETATAPERTGKQNLPDRAVTVDSSTPVHAAGQRHVGSISGVLATDLGQTTHLVVAPIAGGGSIALPAQWIQEIATNQVQLGVTAQLVASAESPLDVLVESQDD